MNGRPRFRPALEQLEDRLVPTTLLWRPSGADHNWGTAGNWLLNGMPSPRAPGNSDLAKFDSGNTTECVNASGTGASAPGGLDLEAGYTGKLTLSGDLTAGNATTANTLAGGNIGLSGHTLTLANSSPTHDTWSGTNVSDDGAGGGGTGKLYVGGADYVDFTSATTLKMNDHLQVGGTLRFKGAGLSGTGGLDFGSSGYFDVTGSLSISPSTTNDITFTIGAGNTQSHLFSSYAIVTLDDALKTIDFGAISLVASGHASVYLNAETTAKTTLGITLEDNAGMYLAPYLSNFPTTWTGYVDCKNSSTLNVSSYSDTNTDVKIAGNLTVEDSSTFYNGANSSFAKTTAAKVTVTGNMIFAASANYHVYMQGYAADNSCKAPVLAVNGSVTFSHGTLNTTSLTLDFTGIANVATGQVITIIDCATSNYTDQFGSSGAVNYSGNFTMKIGGRLDYFAN